MGISSICVEQYCSMSLRIFRSSFLTKLMATPFLPKRPLRPIRWMQSSRLVGRSQLMTRDTCWTSRPRPQRSVVIKILEFPCLNSLMMRSLSFWFISPCMLDTVKLFSIIFLVSHYTLVLVLQKMTAWVMVKLSYRSHRVSNFHSSLSIAMKNCLIPSRVSSSRFTKILIGLFMNFLLISRIYWGRVALTITVWVWKGKNLKIQCTWSLNPFSPLGPFLSISSASSKMNILIFLRSKYLC